jgi:hypothetical protein
MRLPNGIGITRICGKGKPKNNNGKMVEGKNTTGRFNQPMQLN